MSSYYISTDAASSWVVAQSADAAVAAWCATEPGMHHITTVAALESHLERCGGYGYVETEDGERLMEVAS